MKQKRTDNLADTKNTVAKGAVTNFLGTLGSLMMPVFFIVANRLYTPARAGVFLLAFTLFDIAVNLTINGIGDGVVMFASRHVDHKDKEDKVYHVLANGFLYVFVLSVILFLFSRIGGPDLLVHYYHDKELLPALQIMAFALPLVAIVRIIIAATHALVIMKWDALFWNFLRPTLLLVFSLLFASIYGKNTVSLAWSFLLSNLVLALGLMVVFHRYFSVRKFFKHLFSLRFDRALLRFAVPQNLNMTFNKLITDLDVMMLGYFKFDPALISFYGMGAQVVRNIRKIKAAFAGIYAPIIARIHEKKDTKHMNETFSMVAGWTALIALPLSLLVIIFRGDLLALFHPSFNNGMPVFVGGLLSFWNSILSVGSMFMIVLVVVPLMDCVFGMAGNIIVMSGHAGWNLFNSIVVACMNAALNYYFIPIYGLLGAAFASVIATVVVITMQLIEARLLLDVRISLKKIYKPMVALLPSLVFVVWLLSSGRDSILQFKLIAVGIMFFFYFGLLWLLKTDSASLRSLFSREGEK